MWFAGSEIVRVGEGGEWHDDVLSVVDGDGVDCWFVEDVGGVGGDFF